MTEIVYDLSPDRYVVVQATYTNNNTWHKHGKGIVYGRDQQRVGILYFIDNKPVDRLTFLIKFGTK